MSSVKDLGSDLQANKGLVNDERWQLALRVAASEKFRRSARLRDFLLFICKKTLQGLPEEVHEQYIGCAVFGRPAGYNAGDDNIVRVEARELRKRLEQYFAGAGKKESLEIRIPKGSYVPLFEAPKPRAFHLTERRITYALLGALLLAMTFGFWQWKAKRMLQATLADATGRGLASQNVLWSRLFDSRRETYIVVGDSGWCFLQRSAAREYSLDDYVSRRPLNSVNTREWRQLTAAHYAGMPDVTVLAGLLHATAPFQTPTRVRFARDISLEDLRSNNFILVGGICSNPWGELFEPLRNFRESRELASGIDCYVNNKLLSGESARYCYQAGPGVLPQTYCLISFVPNLNRSGNGLIIAGTSGVGTRAGGEFLTRADLDSKLRQYLKLGSQETNLPYFELLLKTSGIPHGSLRIEYVTHRILTVRND